MTKGRPGAVVVSVSNECCPSALTHAKPGAFFDANGDRKARSCASDAPDYQWNGDERAAVWHTFMQDLAAKRSVTDATAIYIDASFIAGKPAALLDFIASVDISGW